MTAGQDTMAWKHSLQDEGGKKKERASVLPCHRGGMITSNN